MITGDHSSSADSGLIEVRFLQLVSGERSANNIAAIALDDRAQVLVMRFREDWQAGAEEIDLDDVTTFIEDVTEVCLSLDAASALFYLQNTLPAVLRLTPSKLVQTGDIEAETERLVKNMIGNVEPMQLSNSAPVRFRLLTLEAAWRRLREAIGECARMRLNASELTACAGSAFATLALIVAGWQLFPAAAQPHINKHEQHSASTPALSASAAVRGELKSIAAAVSETPDRRPLKRRKRQSRIGEERRAYKQFQRPADKIDTAEVVMIAAEDVLSGPNESPYTTSFDWPEVPPPPQTRETIARRVVRTLGYPLRAIGALFSDRSRSRAKDDTQPDVSTL